MTQNLDLFTSTLPDGLIYKENYLNIIQQEKIFDTIKILKKSAPFRKLTTKSGKSFSAKITNCGDYGWWSDLKGYRYTKTDPDTNLPWPPMPKYLLNTIKNFVKTSNYKYFSPNSCLINFYESNDKMGIHQDKDEVNLKHPIITISIGASADFIIGGFSRSEKKMVLNLKSGSILILGGKSRMRFHGIKKIHNHTSPIFSLKGRISLTFRIAN